MVMTPGAAHAGHDDAPGLRRGGHLRLGHRRQGWLGDCAGAGFFGCPPSTVTKLGQSLQARVVLVAGALVDAALAAELGLQRLDGQAVGLHAAVAAALADRFVDDDAAPGRRACRACGGGASRWRRSGRRAAPWCRDLAELALQRVHLAAVVDGDAGQQAWPLVLLGLVGHHADAPRAFGQHALHDLQHAVALGSLAHLLPTGHRDRVVVEDLVGDVDARRDALADGQQAAVEVGAVAEVGEDVRLVVKGACPTQGTPSPPIWVKVAVRRPGIQVTM